MSKKQKQNDLTQKTNLYVVKKGDTLFIMEVMKSEVNHNAPVSGTISQVNISNDQEGVNPGTVAVVIE